MFTRQRRASEEQSTERAELVLDGGTMSLDEFWDAMADELEAMSQEELSAELAPLKAHLARQVH